MVTCLICDEGRIMVVGFNPKPEKKWSCFQPPLSENKRAFLIAGLACCGLQPQIRGKQSLLRKAGVKRWVMLIADVYAGLYEVEADGANWSAAKPSVESRLLCYNLVLGSGGTSHACSPHAASHQLPWQQSCCIPCILPEPTRSSERSCSF